MVVSPSVVVFSPFWITEEENRGAALLDAAETEAAVSLPLTIEEAS